MGVDAASLGDLQRELTEVLGLGVEVLIYMFCDTDKSCMTFAKQNLNPRHMAEDIKDRNYEAGILTCEFCGTMEMPTQGVDVYVCCFHALRGQ